MKLLSLARRRISAVAGVLLLLTGTSSVFSQTSSSNFQVTITVPTNGASFTAPASVPMDALTFDTADDVAAVVFMAFPAGMGVEPLYALNLGTVSNGVAAGSHSELFALTWTNALVGTWALAAEAVRSNGLEQVSTRVIISVNSNLPPAVRITSPPNNADLRAPVNVALLAYAHDPAGYVASVQFFAGSNSLGFGLPVPPAALPPATPVFTPPIFQTNIFELIWSNAPVGSYALTAAATDNTGLSATSAPVNITIQPQPPTTTNKPPVVSIIAADPVAIAGTNCWSWLGLANPSPTWSNWVSPAAVWRWFTNCGPKDATFEVHRAGATNSDLTVNYSIGGTASNGVDYVVLPGVATIPAGQTEAMITVVPTEGETNRATQTVILSLSASTNSPPDYVRGFPPRAEALIVDSEFAHAGLTGAPLGDRSFLVSAGGPDGAWFHVDYTTNFINWTPVCTNQVINGSIDFADPDTASSPARFYRAVPLAGPPPE